MWPMASAEIPASQSHNVTTRRPTSNATLRSSAFFILLLVHLRVIGCIVRKEEVIHLRRRIPESAREGATKLAMGVGRQPLAFNASHKQFAWRDDKLAAFAEWFFKYAGERRGKLLDSCVRHASPVMRLMATLSGYELTLLQLQHLIDVGHGDRASKEALRLLTLKHPHWHRHHPTTTHARKAS